MIAPLPTGADHSSALLRLMLTTSIARIIIVTFSVDKEPPVSRYALQHEPAPLGFAGGVVEFDGHVTKQQPWVALKFTALHATSASHSAWQLVILGDGWHEDFAFGEGAQRC